MKSFKKQQQFDLADIYRRLNAPSAPRFVPASQFFAKSQPQPTLLAKLQQKAVATTVGVTAVAKR